MTDTTRDDALIAEVARAISRKVDSFGDTERTEQQRAELEWPRYREHAKAAIDLILARENWTPPAKPDRYVEVTREVGALLFSKGYLGGLYDNEKNFQAAAAVLRRHFEPPIDVVEAARRLSGQYIKDRILVSIIENFILEFSQ